MFFGCLETLILFRRRVHDYFNLSALKPSRRLADKGKSYTVHIKAPGQTSGVRSHTRTSKKDHMNMSRQIATSAVSSNLFAKL